MIPIEYSFAQSKKKLFKIKSISFMRTAMTVNYNCPV